MPRCSGPHQLQGEASCSRVGDDQHPLAQQKALPESLWWEVAVRVPGSWCGNLGALMGLGRVEDWGSVAVCRSVEV